MFEKRFFLFFLLVLSWGFGGCNGSGNGYNEAINPKDLGKAIGEIYVKTMTAVASMMEPKEDAGVLKPKLKALNEEVIQKLVKLGKIRNAMNPTDRAMVDRQIYQEISTFPREIYDRYNQGYKFYAGIDFEAGNLIANFNIITQYASFELLKKQNPTEAKRLGIE